MKPKVTDNEERTMHQPNVKTSRGPPRGVMVPLVLLVHPYPPWSTFSVKFQKVWIRMDRIRPGGPRGPQPPLVDQERSGPLWTMLRHFPDAACGCGDHYKLLRRCTHYSGTQGIDINHRGSAIRRLSVTEECDCGEIAR